MTFYAIRHGETDWNKQNRLQGCTDIELNENGIRQAEQARDMISKYPIDLIVCSTLKRAVKTAAILNEVLHCKIIYEDALRERGYGEYEGQTTAEFADDPVKSSGIFANYAVNLHYRGVEPAQDLCKRVHGLIDDLIARYPGKNILLVTHGGTIRSIAMYFQGLREDGTMPNPRTPNCCVMEYPLKEQ